MYSVKFCTKHTNCILHISLYKKKKEISIKLYTTRNTKTELTKMSPLHKTMKHCSIIVWHKMEFFCNINELFHSRNQKKKSSFYVAKSFVSQISVSSIHSKSLTPRFNILEE